MPHVAITMIPGRGRKEKSELAQKIEALLIAELGIDPKFVSVSIEDIPIENWDKSMEKFPDDIMFVQPGMKAD
ncbi:tautomerase family protein [Lacrimispora brassicae]